MNFPEESAAIRSQIERASRILVVSHANPDADAIASLLAFRRAASFTLTDVYLAIGPGTIPATLEFLNDLDQISDISVVDTELVDLIVLLDCADQGRVGDPGFQIIERLAGSIPVINIDHHVTNARFGTVNLIDSQAAATCEILALLFEDLGVPLDRELATILLAGIQGDTLGLRTPSTTGRTLDVAADLLRAGADLDTVVDNLFRVRPFSTVKLWGAALSAAQYRRSIVWTEITAEMLDLAGADESEGEGIVNFLAGTQGARLAALLYRKEDGWRVSMRSLADDVDVADLAAIFDGGGHSRAAGCRLGPGANARDEFLETIASSVERPASASVF